MHGIEYFRVESRAIVDWKDDVVNLLELHDIIVGDRPERYCLFVLSCREREGHGR